MITTGHKHDTVPTQSIEADGIRYAYRRFGKPGTTPLVFIQHRLSGQRYRCEADRLRRRPAYRPPEIEEALEHH